MSTSQSKSTAYLEAAQAVASEHPLFKAASFREKADVLELIREHWPELERDGFTVKQAADVALVQVLPIPWCQRCGCYHHDAAPHIGGQMSVNNRTETGRTMNDTQSTLLRFDTDPRIAVNPDDLAAIERGQEYTPTDLALIKTDSHPYLVVAAYEPRKGQCPTCGREAVLFPQLDGFNRPMRDKPFRFSDHVGTAWGRQCPNSGELES